MTETSDPQRIAKVVAWVANPRPVDAIQALLEALTNDEVDDILQTWDGPVAHLAWLEKGKRIGAISGYVCNLTRVKGVVVADVKTSPTRVVDNIHLDLHLDKKSGS